MGCFGPGVCGFYMYYVSDKIGGGSWRGTGAGGDRSPDYAIVWSRAFGLWLRSSLAKKMNNSGFTGSGNDLIAHKQERLFGNTQVALVINWHCFKSSATIHCGL